MGDILERAAAAVGLGSDSNVRFVPPNINQIYEELQKKEKLTVDDVQKYPWLFPDGAVKSLHKWEPSYEAITGGQNHQAIDMLMGPNYKSVEVDTSRKSCEKEIHAKQNSDRFVRSHFDIVKSVMAGFTTKENGKIAGETFRGAAPCQ